MKFIKPFAVALLLVLGGFVSLYAQSRELSGTVLDSQQQPIIGAAVILTGGGNVGSVTDIDGFFQLSVPSGDVILDVSCLGYTSKVITVPSSQSSIKIILAEDNMLLEETVVVGYGTQKRVNLTGAIATVSAKNLENRTSPSLTHMLQGSVPGLNVTTTSGRPGNSASINIRGVNSINGGNPLVLVDGAEGDLAKVNPNDVESISVIKDASAAAIYGARASAGVIIVTTKSGKAEGGKATVRYSGRFGWTEPTTSTEFETRGYYSVYLNDLFHYSKNGTNYTMEQLWIRRNDKVENPERPWVMIDRRDGRDTYVYYANTDWYHELFKDTHPTQQHSLSLSGGSDHMRYFISGAYNYEEGVFRKNTDKMNKMNFRAKFDFDINKYMQFSNNTSYYRYSYFYPGFSSVNTAFSLMTVHALASYPTHNPDGTSIGFTSFANNNYVMDGMLTALDNGGFKNTDKTDNILNTSEFTFKPFKQLEIKANFTYGLNLQRDQNRSVKAYYSKYPGELTASTGNRFVNRLQEITKTQEYYATNVFATYSDTFKEKHNVKLMGGFNWETKHIKDLSAIGYNLLSDTLSDLNLIGSDADGVVQQEVGGGQNEYALAGFFARANSDYMGRYLFEVSGRYDGTSRFAAHSRWGFFPSASVGWRISEEPFFAPAKDVVENLKVRYSYGTLGNQQVGYYDYIRKISIDTQSYRFGNDSDPTMATISAPVSGDLTWETSAQHNIGLDAGLFENKLTLTAEAYIRDTKNMLTTGKDLPATYGATLPKMNAADLRTKGYELSVSYRDMFQLAGKPFTYSITGTFSDYVTDITKFENDTKSLGSHYVGKRWGEIWGYRTDGLFASDEEAKNYPIDQSYVNPSINSSIGDPGLKAGDMKFKDLDGDGKIGLGDNTVDKSGDRTIIGNSEPRYNYGLNLSFQWAGFDFSIFFQGIGKMDWYPAANTIMFWGPYARPYATLMPYDFHKMIWSETNPDAYFPRPRGVIAQSGNQCLAVINDRYLQDISYCRLKNLTIGYTLPQRWTDKADIDGVRLYFSGENLHYWAPGLHTDYIDPEMAKTNSNTMRIYPWQKTFVFGVDLTF